MAASAPRFILVAPATRTEPTLALCFDASAPEGERHFTVTMDTTDQVAFAGGVAWSTADRSVALRALARARRQAGQWRLRGRCLGVYEIPQG